MYAIATNELTHHFKGTGAVPDNISLRVPSGSIYGFLGPNGAGKSTTLRLVLGLLRRQAGEILVFDQELERHRLEILRRTGSLIESPSVYAHLTARENLSVYSRVLGCKKERIGEVLGLVGLAGTGKKRAGKFSLGMKQRLGIAIALLNRPSLLILDEPVNGLDPNGIIEMRGLLKELNRQEGTTIVISSHLLAEIERTATHVGIINKGRLLFQGALEALALRQSLSGRIVVETNDPEGAAALFRERGMEASLSGGRVIIGGGDRTRVALLSRLVVDRGFDLYRIGIEQDDLESIFIDMVNESI